MNKLTTSLSATSLADYLSALAARTSTPGGGAVAALNAAEACALTMMMLAYTKQIPDSGLQLAQLEQGRDALVQLADDDMAAFAEVMKHWQANSNDEISQLDDALLQAAAVPARVIEQASPLVATLLLLHEQGNKHLLSDLAIAADLLRSSLAACDLNIHINLASLPAAQGSHLATALSQSSKAQASLAELVAEVRASLTQASQLQK